MFANRIQIIIASVFCLTSILQADFPFEEAWRVEFEMFTICIGSTWLDEDNVRYFLIGATNRAYIISEGEISWESPELPGVVTVMKRIDFGVGDGPEIVLNTVDDDSGRIHIFSGDDYAEHNSYTLFGSTYEVWDGPVWISSSQKEIKTIDIFDSNLPDDLKRVFIGNIETSSMWTREYYSEHHVGGGFYTYSIENEEFIHSFNSGSVRQTIQYQTDGEEFLILGSTELHYKQNWGIVENESLASICRIDTNGQPNHLRTLAHYEGDAENVSDRAYFHCFQLLNIQEEQSLIVHYREDFRDYIANVSLPEFAISGIRELPEGHRAYRQIFTFQQEEQGELRYYLLGFQNHYVDVYDVDDLRLVNQVRIEPALAIDILFDNFDDDDEFELAFLSPRAFTYYDLGRLGVDSETENAPLPTVALLNPAYPNPFNGMVTIPYRIPISGNVNIAVYDSFGREIALLSNDFKPSGSHQITWMPVGVPSGTYMVSVGLASSVSVIPVTLVK